MKNESRILVPVEAINPCYHPYLKAQQYHQIYFGGAGSGKSVFLACRAVLDALTGRNTLIVRQVARTLRHSCFNEVQKAMNRLGLNDEFVLSSSQMSLTCKQSGAQILFLGLDDVEKIKSLTPQWGALTDIWLEEATECRYEDMKQLEKRLRGLSPHKKRLTMSFNPVSKSHWIYKQFFTGWQEGQREQTGDKLLIFKTTYRDNMFLTEDDRRNYENEQDEYFHRVYTLGEWGQIAGAIFTDWHEEDLSAFRYSSEHLRFGLDFGYARDPAAAMKVQIDMKHRRVYVLDELYEKGLSNEALAVRLQPMAGAYPIVCDSAEPKSIAQLRRFGLSALAARKGPDSLRHGIRFLQGMKIICDHHCRHTMQELQEYRWREDIGGMALPLPQGPDHLLDALRYALEQDSRDRQAEAMGRRSV